MLNNTVSSVIGNTVTVVAALVSMLILSWQLTIVAVVLLPVLVLAQRQVGQVRARIATQTQESLSEMTAITQETLSVSGILLAKTFNRQPAEIARYANENDRPDRPAGAAADERASGSSPSSASSCRWCRRSIYLVAAWLILRDVPVTAGTIVAFTTVQARLHVPAAWGCCGWRSTCRPRGRCSPASSSTSTWCRRSPMRRMRAPVDPARLGRGRVPTTWCSAIRMPRPTRPGTLQGVSFRIEPGQYAAFVGPSGAGKTTVSYLVPRLYEATEGAVLFAGDDVRELRHASLDRERSAS